MAYSMQIDGMDEIVAMLQKAEDRAQGVAARGLYKGAGVVADAITAAAGGIGTAPFKYAAGGFQRMPSPEEKAALLAGGPAGIAKFDKNGNSVNTIVGYGASGYVDIAGHQKAVAQIANAINSGTSFMKKQPFIRKAATKAKGAAEGAINSEIESLVGQLLK